MLTPGLACDSKVLTSQFHMRKPTDFRLVDAMAKGAMDQHQARIEFSASRLLFLIGNPHAGIEIETRGSGSGYAPKDGTYDREQLGSAAARCRSTPWVCRVHR
jgi:hypothetical protein